MLNNGEFYGVRVFNLNENMRNPKCHVCGKECFLIGFSDLDPDLIEGFKEKGLYLGRLDNDLDVVALCHDCCPNLDE
jgi:hypothetical protein